MQKCQRKRKVRGGCLAEQLSKYGYVPATSFGTVPLSDVPINFKPENAYNAFIPQACGGIEGRREKIEESDPGC